MSITPLGSSPAGAGVSGPEATVAQPWGRWTWPSALAASVAAGLDGLMSGMDLGLSIGAVVAACGCLIALIACRPARPELNGGTDDQRRETKRAARRPDQARQPAGAPAGALAAARNAGRLRRAAARHRP